MSKDLEQLRDLILQLGIGNDEERVALQLLDNIKKDLTKQSFRLERARKEKNSLSTLLSRTSEDL